MLGWHQSIFGGPGDQRGAIQRAQLLGGLDKVAGMILSLHLRGWTLTRRRSRVRGPVWYTCPPLCQDPPQ